jgi:hypothetical protein
MKLAALIRDVKRHAAGYAVAAFWIAVIIGGLYSTFTTPPVPLCGEVGALSDCLTAGQSQEREAYEDDAYKP